MASRVSRKGSIEKKKRFQYSPSKVKSALQAIEDGMQVATASKLFQVPRTTLRNKLCAISPAASTGHCGPHSVLGEDVENMLVGWVIDCANMGFPVNKEDLCASVKKLLDAGNQKQKLFINNLPGRKWYYSFLKRHPTISQKHGEYVNRARGAVTEEKIRKWFQEVKESLKENNNVLQDPRRVFNMDETCFFLAPKGDLILGPRGRQVYDESSNSDKENVTTLFAANAEGKFAPSLTVYKYTRIPANVIKAAPPKWGIGKTENGWMTGESFYEYITNVFLPFLIESEIARPIIIFLDGHKSHLTVHLSNFCRENQIILVALYPNSTHILQPLDVAVFGPLKHNWKRIVRQWRTDHNNQEVSKADVPSALAKIISEPKMEANVRAGFAATGLYPFDADKVDYSKCIARTPSYNRHIKEADTLKHLEFLESRIDCTLLQQFRQTRNRNHDWEGNPHALLLFDLWKRVANESMLNLPKSKEKPAETSMVRDDNSTDSSVLAPETSNLQNRDSLPTNSENEHNYSSNYCNPTHITEIQHKAVIESNNSLPSEDGLCISPITPNASLENVFTTSPFNLPNLSSSPNLSEVDFNTLPIGLDSSSNILTPNLFPDDINQEIISNRPISFLDNSTTTLLSSPGTSTAIQITPPKTIKSIFKDVIKWPEVKESKSKRKTETTPSVITSDLWMEFYKLKEEKKQEEEKQKAERKMKRELNKKQKEASKNLLKASEKNNKKKKLQNPIHNSKLESASSSCDEEWIESGDSLDDIELLGEVDDPQEINVGENTNLKVGDFVLTKFFLAGKKSPRMKEFKYVGIIMKAMSDNEFEIQCLKSIDSKQTRFVFIENDISQINIDNIIGKLPEPTLKEEGRMLVYMFSGSVKTVEKH